VRGFRRASLTDASQDRSAVRATLLLSAASLVAAFLGNAVLTSGKPLDWSVWLSVVLFAVMPCC
jgi:hypothetical protein